jgi:serine/threonine protein kinase
VFVIYIVLYKTMDLDRCHEIFLINNNFILHGELGKGKFGKIYKAWSLLRSAYSTLKIINLPDDVEKKTYLLSMLQNEITILKFLSQINNSENYVTIYRGCLKSNYIHNNYYMIITDYIEGMTLDKYIKRVSSNLTINLLIVILYQLIACVKFIHDHGYVHRDIKPENILYDENSHRFKLIDFGFTFKKSESDNSSDTIYMETVGTPLWMPCEAFDSSTTTFEKSKYHDIWSLGLIYYNIINNKLPICDNHRNVREFKKYIRQLEQIKSNYTSSNKIFDERINSLIECMLHKDWTKRPTATYIYDKITQIYVDFIHK